MIYPIIVYRAGFAMQTFCDQNELRNDSLSYYHSIQYGF